MSSANLRPRDYSGPIAWMSRHGVAPNLLMAFLIIGGFLISLSIKKEFIPTYEADKVIVSVAYPGATPTEMEQGVILPIENELAELDGFKEITASATQGSASVIVELDNGMDRQQAYQDIQQAVNRITTFPDQIERPVVRVASRAISVVELALFGPLSQFELKRLAERVKDELLQSPDISKVELTGVPDEEIHIEISQLALQRYGLTLAQVASAVGGNAIEQSAGTVRTPGGDILVALDNRSYWANDFLSVPIVADLAGVRVTLGDLAKVTEGFSDTNELVTYNGQEAIRFDIYRAERQTPLTVAEAVHSQLETIRAWLPPGVEVIVTDDDGKTYKERVGLLLKNAIIGLILVMVLLSLFLEFRLAFWVTMGIPTAFMGSLLLLPAADVSINMISMFAFIVALGIVVDDAIIAGENIFEHMQQGVPFKDAAVIGAKEVSGPLAFAILTNIVAFLPLLALPGMMGKLFLAIPIVVVSCFLISWIDALFILPTHLANLKEKPTNGFVLAMDKVQDKVEHRLARFINETYRPFLKTCLKHPAMTLTVAISILFIVMSVPMSGRMGFSMFPRLEGEFAVATVEMPSNVPFDQARNVRELVEQRLYEVVDEVEKAGAELLVSVEGSIEGSTIEVEA
ncbi:MAG: efflux RND transporter permease subunit, partial [Oceanobacter sp.]